jgi:sensor domain CHASE-containing protein
MNPFNDLPPRPQSSHRTPFLARPAPVLFAACLVVGLGVVGWRATARYKTAHALAHVEVRARAAALVTQLNQVPAAAEALGALAKQGRGVLTDFQRVAKELGERYPDLTTLELQPGGTISEVVPRENNERALGVSVLKDAGQAPAANEAIRSRKLTVSGPVRLGHGEQGFVARVPVFQRAANGQESFWGFVAATMSLQRALACTQVSELPSAGYDYVLFVPATSQQKGLTLAASSRSALREVEQEKVQMQGLKFSLAVAPKAGWVDKTTLISEALVVLLFSALAFILVSLLGSRRTMEAELAQATERLNQEQSKRSEAEAGQTETKDQMATVQAELKQAQLALEQANARTAQLEGQLATSARERDEAIQLERAKHKEAQVALAKAQDKIAQLQTRLETATQAETSAAAAAEERLRQNQTALVEMRAKLEASARSAREAAKAGVAELAQLEQSNRELKERLAKAEEAHARVTELRSQLRKAQAELKQWQAAAEKEEEASAAEADGEAQPQTTAQVEELTPTPEASTALAPQHDEAEAEPTEEPTEEVVPVATTVPETSVPDDEVSSPEASVEAAAQLPAVAATDSPAEPVPAPVVELPAEAQPEEPAPAASAPVPKAGSSSVEPPAPEAAPESSEVIASDAPAAGVSPAEPAEAAAEPKPASKPPRRRKRRDDQMDLFGGGAANAQPASKSGPESTEPAPEAKPAAPREKPAPAKSLPAAPPVDAAELRKAVNVILPLLVDQDPGAKDCLRDNRNTFRSAFAPEAYVEFEHLVKRGDFGPALEDLKKAARRHGLPV